MAKTTEAVALIKAFKEPLIALLKEFGQELDYLLDKGIAPYIEAQYRKFKKTNTFLYRNQKVNFYDTYFPISIRSNERHLEADDMFVSNLFSQSNCTTVIGNAGSGKTMLTKHIFLSTVKSKIKIPILLELRFLNDFQGGIIEFITGTVTNNDLAPNPNILERILNNGLFLFILDGFDEIYSANKQRIVNDLDMFIDRHPNNFYLITSRPGVSIENLPRFENYSIMELNEFQIKEFVEKQFANTESKALTKKMLETINRRENNEYKTYLSNPLLLSMFILTYHTYPELPKSKSKFYWNVFDTLCTKHDSITKKAGYQHERKTGLQNEEVEQILKWLGYISLFEGKFYFDSEYLNTKLNQIKQKIGFNFDNNKLIDDLTVSVSILIMDGLEYRFPHKSLQEYFAALLIKEQSLEAKAKIYSEKMIRLETSSFGGNENLWNLCYEIDRNSFVKYFLIQTLERFLSKVGNRNNDEAVVDFFSFTGYGLGLILEGRNITVQSIHYAEIILHNILRFLEIKSYDFLSFQQYQSDEWKSFLIEMIDSGIALKSEDYNGVVDEDMWVFHYQNLKKDDFRFLKDLGIDTSIHELIRDVRKKHQELIKQQEIDEKNKLDLLDFN